MTMRIVGFVAFFGAVGLSGMGISTGQQYLAVIGLTVSGVMMAIAAGTLIAALLIGGTIAMICGDRLLNTDWE